MSTRAVRVANRWLLAWSSLERLASCKAQKLQNRFPGAIGSPAGANDAQRQAIRRIDASVAGRVARPALPQPTAQPARHRRKNGLDARVRPKYQTHYWYDSKTGESSWTEPPGWSEPSVEAENPETDRLTNKDDELELVDLGPRRRERSQDDSEDESDEDVEMLPSSRADAHTRQVYAETAPTMRQWRCCFYFHANFCEQYCAAAEGLIRAP